MLVDHFWKLIFALVVGVLCWFWWKDASAKKTHETEISHIAQLINVSEGNEPKSDAECTERFFQAISALEAVRYRQGEDFILSATLDEAIALNDQPSAVGGLLKKALSQAFENADKGLRLLDDSDALSRLDDGARPKITSGPWKGQWAEVGYQVPPSIDDSVANRLCNRTLVPESVKAIQSGGEVSSAVSEWADSLKRAKLLDIVAHRRIADEYDLLRKTGR